MPALEVTDLSVRRGALLVVQSVSFTLEHGKMLGFLGLNGAGKSSLLASLAGDLPALTGGVRMPGADLSGLPAWERCKAGLVLVPAGRQLFKSLRVEENLQVGGHLLPAAARAQALERVYELFPILFEKRRQQAGELSGGQQQMLAVGRGLMAEPKVLMLDEPSEGLAPVIVEQMFETIDALRRETQISIVLAEQNAGAVDLLDDILMMAGGQVSSVSGTDQPQAQAIEHYLFGN